MRSSEAGIKAVQRQDNARLRPPGYAAAPFAALGLAEPKLAKQAKAGAGEGNRTLVFSLEGCCSTIELHPRRKVE